MSRFDDMMDYGENRERFNDLKQNLDTIIPFVGAGLSVPFGFPQWGKFLLKCCTNKSMKEEVTNILNSKEVERYELAASYLSEELNKINSSCFEQKIQKVFDKQIPSLSKSPITLFPKLFKGSIITTNFDHVIEKCIDYESVFTSQEDKFSEILKGTTSPVVLKLHGDVSDIKNIILTKKQYDDSYLENPKFQEEFSDLLKCKTFLFLGCSLDQDRTMEFMSRPKSLDSTKYVKNYAFMASPAFHLQPIKHKTRNRKKKEFDAKQKEKEIEERLGKVNILPIWYPEGEHQWIREYLEWLKQGYQKDFLEAFENPLFLEDKYDKKEKIVLGDIYTDPDFVFLNEKNPQENLLEVIYHFMDNTLSDEIKRKCRTTNTILNTLFILGEPGIGKSSLISKIVVESKISREDEFYCLRLRDLDKKTISLKGALNAILKMLSIQESDLKKKTLLLDGVDELCGIENYKTSIDDFCFSLMEEANRLNFKLLFTSRLNYVHLEDTRFDTMLILKLLPFREKQFEHWFHQYDVKRKKIEQTCVLMKNLSRLCNTKKEEEQKKLELFGIPLVLYLLVELEVDISTINSLGQLYDKLFEDLENRFYDGKATHTLPNLYGSCKEIAEYIAKKMFDTKEDMLNSEAYREVIMSLPEELKINVNDILDHEHFYLLSFYYRMDKEKCSVEFIHKSLMEYLVGNMIYCHISKILEISEEEQKEQLQKELDELFTFNAITDEITLFFLEKVKKNEKQQLLFSLLKKYYKFYLEIGFVYKISRNINILDKTQNLFISYWKLLRILANTKKDNLLENEEEKELFCNYLIRNSFKNIDLSYQNLNMTHLSRVDLSEADLRGADLTLADLTLADLSKANLNRADLREADLSRANLNGTYLNEAYLTLADLTSADLSEAHLHNAHLTLVHLKMADLSEADLSKANLNGAYLNRANLSRVNLNGDRKSVV